jgi:hypothetical protein
MAIATASPVVSDREWNAHILAQLAGRKLAQEAALAQLKTAPKSNGGPLSCKQSEKGAVSVYGLQRMPVTLYASQWKRLADFTGNVLQFIAENDGKEFEVEESKDGKKTGRKIKVKISHKDGE